MSPLQAINYALEKYGSSDEEIIDSFSFMNQFRGSGLG